MIAKINICRLSVYLFSFLATMALAQEKIDVEEYSGLYKDHYIIKFKEAKSELERIVELPDISKKGLEEVPWGEPTSGQTLGDIERRFEFAGEALRIFETMNAIYVRTTEKEIERLSKDPRVEYIEQDSWAHAQTTQSFPGWGLDRLDQAAPPLNNAYNYSNTGAGRTIYIMDSGLDVGQAHITAEFGTRASVIWDVNGGAGDDCIPASELIPGGHGNPVASVAAGATYGVAKSATVVMAKITTGCTISSLISSSVTGFDWLAANAPHGAIVNWSHALRGSTPCSIAYSPMLETAISGAHEAGIMTFIAAGNDGCDTANYFSPVNIGDTFAVGAVSNFLHGLNLDERANFSRFGAHIDVWAPGVNVNAMDHNGVPTLHSGTSFSSPYMAGVATLACSANPGMCATQPVQTLYQALRTTGGTGTVVDVGNVPLPAGTTTLFIDQQW